MNVYWRMPNGIDAALQELRPDEMRVLLQKHADAVTAVPAYRARMEDGDFVWWPNSMGGEPFITNVSLTAHRA